MKNVSLYSLRIVPINFPEIEISRTGETFEITPGSASVGNFEYLERLLCVLKSERKLETTSEKIFESIRDWIVREIPRRIL